MSLQGLTAPCRREQDDFYTRSFPHVPWENKVNKETFKVEYDVRAKSSALFSAMAVVRPLGVSSVLGALPASGVPLPLGFFLVSPKTNLAVPSGGLQRV